MFRLAKRTDARFRLTVVILRLVVVLLLFVCETSLLPAQSGDGPFVVRNVRVFDGETVAERRTVVISQGRIAAVGGSTTAVPPGAQEITGDGRTLLPGLMDAHIHLPAFPITSMADALQQTLAFGVTTSVVMGAAPSQFVARIKGLEDTDPLDLASILSAGIYATAPGGHPTQMGGPPFPTLTAPSEADAFVAARVAEGSDFLKIIVDDLAWMREQKVPTLDEATVAALVTAAHARGRIAVAHIGDERSARAAIAAHVDGLAHLTVQTVQNVQLDTPVIYASFLHKELTHVRAVETEAALMVLFDRLPRAPVPYAMQYQPEYVGLRHDRATGPLVDAFHRENVMVWVYTANSLADIARAISIGVDGVISNFPERIPSR